MEQGTLGFVGWCFLIGGITHFEGANKDPEIPGKKEQASRAGERTRARDARMVVGGLEEINHRNAARPREGARFFREIGKGPWGKGEVASKATE